jgi:hypothetical protein
MAEHSAVNRRVVGSSPTPGADRAPENIGRSRMGWQATRDNPGELAAFMLCLVDQSPDRLAILEIPNAQSRPRASRPSRTSSSANTTSRRPTRPASPSQSGRRPTLTPTPRCSSPCTNTDGSAVTAPTAAPTLTTQQLQDPAVSPARNAHGAGSPGCIRIGASGTATRLPTSSLTATTSPKCVRRLRAADEPAHLGAAEGRSRTLLRRRAARRGRQPDS